MKKSTLEAIEAASTAGRIKHPDPSGSVLAMGRWLGGLIWAYQKGDVAQIRMRAAVLAGLCVRIFEEGDPTMNQHRVVRQMDAYTPPYPDDGD